MANANKVMATIKDFLVKMKALDEAIPEDLAQDALEMVEGVKDALSEEEIVKDEETVEEKVEETKDEDPKEEKLEAKVENAMVNVLKKYGLIKDSAMKALDELECEEEEEVKTEDDVTNEEEVTVDPEKINDSARAILRQVKPIIANIKDSKERKLMADSFAKLMKMGNSNKDQYGTILKMANTASKAAMDKASIKKSTVDNDYNFGMDIAKKFNPHYKEG